MVGVRRHENYRAGGGLPHIANRHRRRPPDNVHYANAPVELLGIEPFYADAEVERRRARVL